MPESTPNISELSHSREPLSSTSRLEDIIKVAPEYSDKIRRYESQITPLSPEEQSTLIEKWQGEVSAGTANMRVFGRLILGFRTKERQEENIQVQGEKVQVQGEKKKGVQEDTEIKDNADRINKAAESALKSGEKIQGVIGDTYTPEINARIQKDKSEIQNPDSEIGKLLSSMGIEGTKAQSSPEVERIISARAMTQVYIANQNTILEKHPELKTEIREFEGYRFDLGIQESIQAKNVNKLLSDIPRDTRGQIVDTVTSLTASKPETPVTRTGDTLRFADPQNEKYQYEIDMGKQPPRLAKSLNGLSISRDIAPVNAEEQKRKEAEQELREKQGKTKISEATYADIFKQEPTQTSYQKLAKQESIKKITQEKDAISNGYSTLKSTTEKLDATHKIIEKIDQINDERKKDADLLQDNAIERTLEVEKFALQDISRNLSLELQGEKNIPPGSPREKGDNTFESTAAYNLNFLSYIGYDSLGQDNMERIIRSLNSPNNPRQSEIGEIDLNRKLDTPKTQALTLAIANLVRNGRTTTGGTGAEIPKGEKSQQSWDGVDKADPIIAARQTQSAGFREALIGVKNNLTQEGGSLKTNSQLETVLYGKDRDGKVNNSAINTIGGEGRTSFA